MQRQVYAYCGTPGGRSASATSPRRGYAALLAMAFLVLGTTLAAGLYCLIQSSTAITANEQGITRALGAAECGVQFYQYQIARAARNASLRSSLSSDWIAPLGGELALAISGHNGVSSAGIQADSADPSGLTIKAAPIALNNGSAFSARLYPTSDLKALMLEVTGVSGTISRKLNVTLNSTAATGPVTFPLMARGGIPKAWNVTPDGSSKVKQYGTITPVPLTDGTAANIMLYPGMTVPTSSIPFPNNDSLIEEVAALGLKPITDTSTQTTQTATTPVLDKKGRPTGATQTVTTVLSQNSCYIPPNTNPTLTGTLNGVIYVKWPNNVILDGAATLNCTIVFERKGNKAGTSSFTLNRNGAISRSMDNADVELKKLALGSDLEAQLLWWTLIAPDADFVLPNGTVWDTTKTFEGSLNFKSFSRQGSGDQAGFCVTKGGLVAEGTIDIGSNGASYTVNPDTTSGSSSTATGGLLMSWTSYNELN